MKKSKQICFRLRSRPTIWLCFCASVAGAIEYLRRSHYCCYCCCCCKPMSAKICVECHMPIDTAAEAEVMMTTDALFYNHHGCCLCPVHEKCLQDRILLCIRAGVVQARCARCWAVLWIPRKRGGNDGEQTPSLNKRQRMV